MADVASLIIEVNTSGVTRATTSLGQLETQGQQTAEATSQLRDSINSIGKAFTAAAVVGVGSLALLTKETLSYTKEVENLARLSGINADEFQRYAAGAKLVGVEQDKLSDIFKDTNDKIGDFLQTGGGPLVDFFDNIAPKVGVTAEQFRELSGPKALELYVTSLQKANVSQNEMTFFMEAIASDATALIPLLNDNGQGFKFLGDEAARAGAIMSTDTLDAAKTLNAALYVTGQATLGFKNTITDELLPTLADLAIAFNEFSVSGSTAAGVGEFIADSIRNVSKVAAGAVGAFDLLGKALGGLIAINAEVLRFGNVSAVVKIVGDDLKQTALDYGKFINDIGDAGTGENIPDSIKQIKSLFEASKDLSLLNNGEGSDQQSKNLKNVIDRYSELLPLSEVYNQSLRTPLEIYQDEIVLLNELNKTRIKGSDEALLSNENFARGSAEAFDKFNASLDDSVVEFREFNGEATNAETLIGNLQTASEGFAASFADALIDGGVSFESFANGILKQLQKIALEKAFAPVFGGFSDIIGGLLPVSAADFIGPMQPALPSLEGGGFTGSGSRSGGVDGRGGFNAILHPNETIIDHTKGQGMGSSNNIVVNVDASGSSTSGDADGQNLGNLIGIAVRSVLIEESRPGGMLA